MYTGRGSIALATMISEREAREVRKNALRTQELRDIPGAENLVLIAHRGMGPSSLLGSRFEGSDVLPENTIKAFKQAILLGADGIELDIFKSKDGHLMVIHDDELWRNVYGIERDGSALPRGETKDSFKVGQKSLAELQRLEVGPSGEKIPILTEVFNLAKEANKIRSAAGLKPLILNIELKDAAATNECLDLIQDYMDKNPDSGVDFSSICFCSFNHECLKSLKEEAVKRGIYDIQIAPGIKTATLFGKENVNPDFTVKAGAKYDEEGLAGLESLVEENGFTAYDAVLWDIGQPLVDLAKSGNKQLHASTSDFRQYHVDPSFAESLHRMNQQVTVYFKCDEIARARDLLTNIAREKYEDYQERQRLKQIAGVKEEDSASMLQVREDEAPITYLSKPKAYSALVREKQKIEEALDNALNGPKKLSIAEKGKLLRRLNELKQQLNLLEEPLMQAKRKLNPPAQMVLHDPHEYRLPTLEEIQHMNKEQLEYHKRIIEEKKDGLKAGLERNKYHARLGNINLQLSSLEKQNADRLKPKIGNKALLFSYDPHEYRLPTLEEIQHMNKEQLEHHKRIIEEKKDGLKVGLERNKYHARLGNINLQLSSLEKQNADHLKPKNE